MTEDDLWQPQSALEPMLDGEALQRIDDYADSVEIDRLLGMKVIQWQQLQWCAWNSVERKIRAFLEKESEKGLMRMENWLQRILYGCVEIGCT